MAENTRAVGSVTYTEAGEGYFEKRKLRRHAAFWSLWALGVGAVISGDFYGWNFGLGAGGFGGLLIAGIVIAIMYYGLVLLHRRDVPRAAAHRRRLLVRAVGDGPLGRVPHRPGGEHGVRHHAGGGRRRDGPADADIVVRPDSGVDGDLVEQPGALVGRLLHHLRRHQHPRHRGHDAVHRDDHRPVARASCVLLPRGALLREVRLLPADEHLSRTRAAAASCRFGIGGIFKALPFAIWFFLAIEELPLAAEESHDPERDVPRATIWGITTLLISAILTLFLNTGVGGGAATIGTSGTPLLDGFKAIFGEGTGASLLGLLGLIGLIASFFTIIFAYGRNTYSLSRAGYFPQVPLDHARDAQDAARRADRRRGRRVRPVAGHLLRSGRARAPRRARSWRAAEHGGVRRRDLVLHADACRSSCCDASCRTSSGRTGARWASGARRSPAGIARSP